MTRRHSIGHHADSISTSDPPTPPQRWRPRPWVVGGAGVLALAGAAFVGSTIGSGTRTAEAVTAAAPATITVTGTGKVSGTPDTATVVMGVTAAGASATDALDRNNAEMASLQQTLTAAGVATSAMQTSGLDLQPNYSTDGTVTGYQADDDLTVTLDDLSLAGTTVDAAAHAVGNDVQIQGISFSISDTSPLLKQAREEAMQDAASTASALAAGAGTTLGPIIQVTDRESVTAPVFAPGAITAAGSTASVPIQAGTQPLSVQVQVVYQLSG